MTHMRSLSLVPRHFLSRLPQNLSRHRLAPLALEALLVLAVAAMLAAPAIWNGYPLLYHDTEDYVTMSFTWDPPLWRTVPYAVIVWLGRAFGSLWAVAGAQALFGAWVLHELSYAFLPRWKRAGFLAMAAVLATFTGLPWATSEIMPDVFAGFVPLIVGTLALGENLGRGRRLLLAALGAVAIMVHMSHVAVAAGLVLVLVALWLVSRWWSAAPRPALALASFSVILGIVAIPVIHTAATGQTFFSRGGRVLQMALFIQNGVAKTYLDEVCPKGATLKLCPYRDHLPKTADAFLWANWESPFWKLGGWTGMQSEADRIVSGAIEEFPGEVAKAAAANTWIQYWDVQLGDGLGPKNHAHWPGEYRDVGKARYPNEFQEYISARQQQGRGIDFRPLNDLQVPIAVLGRVLIILLTISALRRADRVGAGLGVVVILALLGNAIVCGAISNPHERYQNRVVWDALAVAMILAARSKWSMPFEFTDGNLREAVQTS